MEIYLVGGAVRDQLLDLPIQERDWVVVGATESEMLARGYHKVGRDFPVFLHPLTHEEYALARTERKIGKGYTQFICDASPTVTLAEDLRRRDLTINAMARTLDGKLIDLYGGQDDLKNKILRHVSPAFSEDPVRVLRVARFAAKFGDFVVHPSTQQLMHQILENGELDALVPERVWQEFQRALGEVHPEKFFMVLQACGAMTKLFPELYSTLNITLPPLQLATQLSHETEIRFAALMGNLDKIAISAFCQRYRLPRTYYHLAKIVNQHQESYLQLNSPNAVAVLSLLETLDAFRQPLKLQRFALTSEIVAQCNKCSDQETLTLNINHYPRINFLLQAYNIAKSVNIKPLLNTGISGVSLKEELRKLRLLALENFIASRSS